MVDVFIYTNFNIISATWLPTFTGYDGRENVKVDEWRFIIGQPDCVHMQHWPVYHDPAVS